MIDSFLYLITSGSNGMPEQESCLVLGKGESFFKDFEFGKWKSVNVCFVYSLTGESDPNGINSPKNYSLFQTSPESRIWFGLKNENNLNLPLQKDSIFIGLGGPSYTASLNVISTPEKVSILPYVSGSNVYGFCATVDNIIYGTINPVSDSDVIHQEFISGSYSSTPYNYLNMRFVRSGSKYTLSYTNEKKSSCDYVSVSSSISSFSPTVNFSELNVNIPPNIFMSGVYVKSPEFYPRIRLHTVAVLRTE